MTALVGSGLVAVAVFFLYPRWMRWNFRQHYRQWTKGYGESHLGRTELTLENHQLETRSKLGAGTIKLSAIRAADSTTKYLFIHLISGNALIVPKARVSSGNVEAFAEELGQAVPVRMV